MTPRFYAQRALAWQKASRGDWIPAMHLLDSAFAFAPDAMRRGLIFADRARISMAIGERISAASSCANAFECFSEIEWSGAPREEAMGVFAAMDVMSADRERALTLFQSASAARVSRLIGGGHGRRSGRGLGRVCVLIPEPMMTKRCEHTFSGLQEYFKELK